ncbi:MAG: SelL-related redox protein [Deltaproteobacteria bacterium]|nr:SelL-related redox protein [Deltaproteobacteria bacterium]MDZ4347103.1 SelL-related redox protein [Candidatus Binatia bacterium]
MPCQAHLGEVKATKDQFEARGVSIVVISFAEPRRLAPYEAQHQWPFVLLADPKRTAYDAFTLKRLSWLQVFSLTTLKLYWRLLREGKKREDYGKDDIYQSGGDFLIDRDGNLLFSHRSQDPADRPTAAKLLEIIDRIAGGASKPSFDTPSN